MAARVSVSARLSVVYLIFSVVWIVFTGNIAEQLSGGSATELRRFEQYKGLAFVIGSTILLYFVSRGFYRKIQHALDEHRILLKKNSAIGIATKEGIYEYDVASDTVTFNDNMKSMIGTINLVEPQGRKFWEQGIHPDDRTRVLAHFENARLSGKQYWIAEYRFKTAEGNYKDLLHSVYVIQDNEGRAQSVIGAIQDLTGLRQLEREYHQQQVRQKTLIANSIIEAEEKERNRWAEELHDNIAQVLSVANLYTGLLSQPGANIPETADRIKEMIELAVTEIRQLSANLKPPRFEDQNLKEAIKLLVYYLKQVKQIHFTIQIDQDSEEQLTDEQKLMVYRIIQEQLNNIVKYADAANVLIIVTVADDGAEVLVKDDGKGFDPATYKEGTGLRNIRSRLELFQGNMELLCGNTGGCELRASFQL